MSEIKLGAEVRCRVTGFTGIATERLERLDGVTEIGVTPKKKDSGYPKTEYINSRRLEVIGDGLSLPPERKVLGFHYPPAA